MFDASELGGQNLVTFEELYDLKNPEEPVKVAEHKDIDDESQTVLIRSERFRFIVSNKGIITLHTLSINEQFCIFLFQHLPAF